MLSAAQQAARDGKVTASFMPALVTGDESRILNEWRRLIGDPSYEPEDLSDQWPVQLGSFLEPFILDWHERRTEMPLTRRGEVVVHPTRPWLSCTLDAWRALDRTVIDAKVSGGFQGLDEVIAYYTPQVAVQKACTRADRAALLIVYGGREPQEIDVFIPDLYADEIMAVAEAFYRCVETLTPPVELPQAPPPPEKWRTLDLDQDEPNWAGEMRDALTLWSITRDAHRDHDAARLAIKALVPADVGTLISGPFRVTRARNRAITIRCTP